MDQNKLLTELKSALKSVDREHWQIEYRDDCPSSDAVLHTNYCVAFFVLVPSSDQIMSIHKKAQNEISALSQTQKASWPRDINMVILVTDNEFTPTACADARTVVEDRFYCRKFVLHLNGNPLSKILRNLPFWPITPSVQEDDISVSFSVKELLQGFDSELTRDLASVRPGVDRIADKILKGEYQLVAESSTGRKFITRERSEQSGIKITGLDIINFRGIKSISHKKMPLAADVTIVYGPNGIGKTSIADALEWVVTGKISHVEPASANEPDPIINLLSPDYKAEVTCHLDNSSSVSRIKEDFKEIKQINGEYTQDNRGIIDHVVGTKAPAGVSPLPIQKLQELFSGTHLLAQHNMRKFLEQANASERFDTLTNMIGAEEFVRFRDKTASVSQRLEATLHELNREIAIVHHELKSRAAKIDQARTEVKGIQNVLSKDRSAIQRIQDLTTILEQIGCVFDKELLNRLREEHIDKHIDGVLSYLEPIIASKKKESSELLFKLENLNLSAEQKFKIHEELEDLHRKLSKQDESLSNFQNEYAELTKRLSPLIERRENLIKESFEAESKHKRLSWLFSFYDEYIQSGTELNSIETKSNSHLMARRKLEDDLREKENSLSTIQGALKKTLAMIADREQKLSRLKVLVSRLDEVRPCHDKIKVFNETIAAITQKTKNLYTELEAAKELSEISNSLANSLRRAYEGISSGHETRQTLLARLYELTDSPKCSLCGREFSSVDEAKSTIKQQLASIPKELSDITQGLEKAKKDDEHAKEKVQKLTDELKTKESYLELLRLQKAAAIKKTTEYVLECKNISVELPEDNPDKWLNTINNCLAMNQIDKLIVESESLKNQKVTIEVQIEKLRQMITTENTSIEKIGCEKESLKSRVVKLQTEIINYKYDPQKMPSMENLRAELTSVKSQIQTIKSQLAEQDDILKPLVIKNKELKEKIAFISEDINRDKKKMSTCESIWGEFYSLCQIVSVKVDDFHNSIQKKKQTALGIKNSLEKADNVNLELQQYAQMERKYSELQNLVNEHGIQEKRLTRKQSEADHVRRWHEMLKKLETEVSKQQIATVGSYLKKLEPTMQLLYSRLNPHPIFGGVKVMVNEKCHTLDIHSMTNQELELEPITISPSKFFSEAQLNVLAISVFLSGALQQKWSRFKTLIIDDPIQQMDEMNVAAFLDLVRGLAGIHQFIIFTCSRDFYLLALDKLECLNQTGKGRFNAYRLEGIAPADLVVHCDTNSNEIIADKKSMPQ